MGKEVLIPVDGSDTALGALAYVLESFPGSSITTLRVIDTGREWFEGPWMEAPWVDRAKEVSERCHAAAQEIADGYDITLESDTLFGVPHKKILGYVQDGSYDHIAMGSFADHPTESSRYLGNVAEKVATRAPLSVTVVPESLEDITARDLPGHILVPLDGAGPSRAALAYAREEFPETRLTGLHVVEEANGHMVAPTGTYRDEHVATWREDAESLLDEVQRTTAGDIEKAVNFGKAGPRIIEYASEHACDQIIMGSRGRRTFGRVLMGSVVRTVLQRSNIPVTIVREPSISAQQSP